MSRKVFEKGNLKLIPKLNNETLEEQCERILKERINNFNLYYHNTYSEAICDEFYDEYYVYKNNLYELEYEVFDSCDIAEGVVNPNGTIDFYTIYYDGGGCLHEMLDIIMDKIK